MLRYLLLSTSLLQRGPIRGVDIADIREFVAAQLTYRLYAGGRAERRVGRISEQDVQLLGKQPRLAGTADKRLQSPALPRVQFDMG